MRSSPACQDPPTTQMSLSGMDEKSNSSGRCRGEKVPTYSGLSRVEYHEGPAESPPISCLQRRGTPRRNEPRQRPLGRAAARSRGIVLAAPDRYSIVDSFARLSPSSSTNLGNRKGYRGETTQIGPLRCRKCIDSRTKCLETTYTTRAQARRMPHVKTKEVMSSRNREACGMASNNHTFCEGRATIGTEQPEKGVWP